MPIPAQRDLETTRIALRDWIAPKLAEQSDSPVTDVEISHLDADDHLAHTNHYVHPEMVDYEASASSEGSSSRLQRARELLTDSLDEVVTRTRLREILSDHESAEPLCRHGSAAGESQTAFWCIADVTARTIMYGRGNPCDSETQLYVFS